MATSIVRSRHGDTESERTLFRCAGKDIPVKFQSAVRSAVLRRATRKSARGIKLDIAAVREDNVWHRPLLKSKITGERSCE